MPRALKPIVLLLALITAAAVVWMIPTRQFDPRVSRSLSELGFEVRDHAAFPFELARLDGSPVRLEQFQGRWVLVNFWASWCEPCREEMPSMREFARSFSGDRLRLLAISLDESDAEIRKFLIDQGITPEDFVVAHDVDGEVSARYGSRLLPETWIVDPDGHVVGRVQGAVDWTRPDILELFEVLLRDGWRIRRS